MRRICTVILLFSIFLPEEAKSQAEALAKLSHCEPLYMDLVRDLGARKGEKELNVGLSLEDNIRFHTMGGFVEYEFAPLDRWGLEVEVPFSVHFKTDRRNEEAIPSSTVNGIKLATQYTFLVSPRHNLSMALGYSNDLEFNLERQSGKYLWQPENVSHPFFVAAKSWKTDFHTLLYTGPSMGVDLHTGKYEMEWLLNTNLHYMFSGTKHFLGLEINHRFPLGEKYGMVLRPQARVALNKQFMLGFVVGVPVISADEGLSFFCRLIYEPKRKR